MPNFKWGVRVDLTEKVPFEQRSEEGETVYCVGICEKYSRLSGDVV